MTEAVQATEVVEAQFLGLNKEQLSTVVALSSLLQQLPGLMAHEEMDVIMDKLTTDPKYGNLKEALFWTCGQRNRLMQLSHTVSFALSLITQVEDHLIHGAFTQEETK